VSAARSIRYEVAVPEGSRSLNGWGLGGSSCSVSSDDNGWRLRPNKILRKEFPSMVRALLPDLGGMSRSVPRFSLGRRKGVRRLGT
jgi:hypothetical protein